MPLEKCLFFISTHLITEDEKKFCESMNKNNYEIFYSIGEEATAENVEELFLAVDGDLTSESMVLIYFRGELIDVDGFYYLDTKGFKKESPFTTGFEFTQFLYSIEKTDRIFFLFGIPDFIFQWEK